MMRDLIHPSETLREHLDACGISAVELARSVPWYGRISVPVVAAT